MNHYMKLVTDQVSKLPFKILKNVSKLSSNGSDSELEHVFDQISTVIKSNQSQIVTSLDKFSNSAAYVMVDLLDKHFLLINYGMLVFIATLLVTFASFASVTSIPYTALPPTKLHPLFDPSDFDLDQDCQIVYADKKKKGLSFHHLDEKQAILLPLSSGITLMVLYFVVTKLHLQWRVYLLRILNSLMMAMSIPAGIFVYNFFGSSMIRYLSHWTSWNSLKISPRIRITISDDNEEISRSGWLVQNFQYRDAITNELEFRSMIDKFAKDDSGEREYYAREFTKPKDVKSIRQIANIYANNTVAVSLILSMGMTACYYFVPNDWLVTNVISMNFAIWSVSQLKLKNLKSGVFILFALFLYDIYFVFGTKVMVTVAQNLDLPIKLSLPTKFNVAQSKFEFSVLGLGDIVLPGSFISLCYKYDIWKWHYDNNDIEFHLLNWSYVGKYFLTSLLSYVLALCSCMFAHATYKAAQPALLYIVPFMLISTILLAWVKGDLQQFWNFQYDVIELGENKLNSDGDEEEYNMEQKEFPTTYSDFFQSECIDDDEDDYTNNDALIDYESDDDLDFDSDVNEEDYEVCIPEYKAIDILRLLEDAANSSEGEDADFVLDEDESELDSDANTVILDVDE